MKMIQPEDGCLLQVVVPPSCRNVQIILIRRKRRAGTEWGRGRRR